MIKLDQVSFSYQDKTILEEASLQVDGNKVTVILGKNGIGKTTLLSLIDGFLTIQKGTITKAKEAIYIYDHPHLYDYLTGEEYIELIKSIASHKVDEDLEAFIKALELDDAMDQLIHTYSLGMKHKLALLTALMVDYGIYLIDEPLAALDPESQQYMMQFFKTLVKQGKALMISTHMLEVAYELADDIVVFKNKKLEKFTNEFETFADFKAYIINALKTDTV